MSFNVVVTDGFKKHAKGIAKKHRSLKADLNKLIDSLENNPTQGEPLGKDCYKVRMAISSKSKGKSGGSRVITCVKIVNQIATCLPFTINQIKKIFLIKNWTNCYGWLACYKKAPDCSEASY